MLQPRKPGPGGIQELRIPGVHVSQMLRTPVVVSKALAGHDISHASLTYLFARTTGDDPFQRDRYVDEPGLANLEDRQDAEKLINRLVFTPVTRTYAVDARVQPAVDSSDAFLDRLVGVRCGRLVHLVEPLPQRGDLPGLERLRRRPEHGLGRPLDPALPAAAVDRMDDA